LAIGLFTLSNRWWRAIKWDRGPRYAWHPIPTRMTAGKTGDDEEDER
jgi:hypothetical protein